MCGPVNNELNGCLHLRVVVSGLYRQSINARGERIAAAFFILNSLRVFFRELLDDLNNLVVIFRRAHNNEGIAVILQTNNAADTGLSQHLF